MSRQLLFCLYLIPILVVVFPNVVFIELIFSSKRRRWCSKIKKIRRRIADIVGNDFYKFPQAFYCAQRRGVCFVMMRYFYSLPISGGEQSCSWLCFCQLFAWLHCSYDHKQWKKQTEHITIPAMRVAVCLYTYNSLL